MKNIFYIVIFGYNISSNVKFVPNLHRKMVKEYRNKLECKFEKRHILNWYSTRQYKVTYNAWTKIHSIIPIFASHRSLFGCFLSDYYWILNVHEKSEKDFFLAKFKLCRCFTLKS